MFDVTDNPMEEMIDYSDTYTTNEETAMTHGFVVVIVRSDARGNGRKTTLVLGCERSGKYKPYKNQLIRKVTGTKKCDCPFRLRGRPVSTGDGWRLNVVCGYHNHEVAENLEGHAYAGRLNVDELSLVNDMTKNMVKPRNILLTLKEHNKDNVTTIKQIYNARQACRTSLRGPRTELQHLMKLMERDKYVYWHRRHEDSDVVRDIVWTHPDALKLLNLFFIVLIIDTTYKTNKYRLPLLEVVRVTSIELTFSVAFAYMEQEKADNFMWVLEKLKSMISFLDVSPQVIVTDRDIALMNAVEKVFPNATQRSIMVVEHRFNNPLYNELRGLVSRNALALIDDEKQHINYVGIDSSACGCTLRNTHGLPCACQLARYVCMGYQLPITEVHTHWMKLTFNDGGIDGPGYGLSIQPECDEVLRRFEELDLSGKVVLKSKMREVAFLETTTMCPPPDKVKTRGGVKGKFKSKYSTKRDTSFFEHVDAMHSQHESCSTQPPGFQSQPICKKQVTILDQFPSVLHPFIFRVDDVEADGNCGYRAIAASLGFGEDSWHVIRDELSRELVHFRA
ncbi:OTU domain [Sesbania bispinosa]|nr:OTU domain [Sesbania bispinosa]